MPIVADNIGTLILNVKLRRDFPLELARQFDVLTDTHHTFAASYRRPSAAGPLLARCCSVCHVQLGAVTCPSHRTQARLAVGQCWIGAPQRGPQGKRRYMSPCPLLGRYAGNHTVCIGHFQSNQLPIRTPGGRHEKTPRHILAAMIAPLPPQQNDDALSTPR